MKTKIVLLSILTIADIAVVFSLYVKSGKFNRQSNGFVRSFLPSPALPSNVLNIQYNSYYIAGNTRNHIYLGNETAPLHLLVSNTSLSDTQHVNIIVDTKTKPFSGHLTIDSPYFHITDRISHSFFRGTLNKFKIEQCMHDSLFFDEAVPISNWSFAVRTIKQYTREYTLAKKTFYPSFVKMVPGLLEKQIDGMFCTDGMLNYDPRQSLLVYVYYYRNQYICTDTNLELKYRGKTVDTTSRAKIRVTKIKSENSFTLAGPPIIVNKNSCISENNLFINSSLLANNEKKEIFDNVSVIDVYDLKKGLYKFSFYLSDYKNQKIKNFRVFDNTLFAVAGEYLLTYKLNQAYFYD